MLVERCKDRMERLGVRDNDLIPANILWDKRNQKILVIDFEAATEVHGRALQELSNNRKRKWDIKEGGTTGLKSKPSRAVSHKRNHNRRSGVLTTIADSEGQNHG